MLFVVFMLINTIMYYCDPDSLLAWLPVYKNASTTMGGVMQTNGWHLTSPAPGPDIQLFGIIQNPWRRFSKGIAELAWTANERSFEQARRSPYFRMAFFDLHLLPISVQYPEYIDRVHWIPMDSPVPVNQLLNEYFEQHGSKTRITDRDIKHRSSPRKLVYQSEVDTYLMTQYPYRIYVNELNKTDFGMWRDSLIVKQVAQPNLLQRFLKRIWTSE
jgi:hypothetical protein